MRAAVTPRRAWILLAAVVLASEGHSSLVAAAKPHTSAAEAKVDRARLDAFVERAMRLEVAPGLAVVVVKGKERSYARGFGYADREARRRVGPETLFYIASTTKSFTALAAALMQHRGAVDLDAPLSRSLKGARLHPSLSADSITLRDLLTHTHGISQDGPVVFRTAFTGDFTDPLLLELLAEHPPASTGRAFAYGNLGYVVAGLVLQAVDGRSWKEIVQREVLQPAGMKATSAWRSKVRDDRVAVPYEVDVAGFRRLRAVKSDANMHAAGGHFSTILDLARYLEAHLNDGRIEGRQVYPAAVMAETRRKQADQNRKYGEIERFGWGLGWDLGRMDGELLVHRFGGFPGYHCHLSFMPERGIGVAVLVNEANGGSQLAALVAGYAYELWLGRPDIDARYAQKLEALRDQAVKYRAKLAADQAERASRSQALPRPLEAYAGIYESRRLGRIELQTAGGRLMARMGVLASPVEAYDATHDKLRVELTGSGSIVEMGFPPEGGVASRLTYQGEEFTRTSP